MRWSIIILFMLGFAIGLACEIETSGDVTKTKPLPATWRLTPNGWQRATAFSVYVVANHNENVLSLSPVLPHPIILSLFIGLLSVLILLAFSSPLRVLKLDQTRIGHPNLCQIELRSQSWLNGS
ncbi:MAG TPA: hypothetical protein VFE46_18025 [Pirellulales bacterium]|jgi:hypothetical protein|nr:hypothetical protein [Pirellulales bacterium]